MVYFGLTSVAQNSGLKANTRYYGIAELKICREESSLLIRTVYIIQKKPLVKLGETRKGGCQSLAGFCATQVMWNYINPSYIGLNYPNYHSLYH